MATRVARALPRLARAHSSWAAPAARTLHARPAAQGVEPLDTEPGRRPTASKDTLDTPFISDSVPLAEGVLGSVEEILLEVGQSVEEDEVIAVIDTAKVSLDVKATRSGVVSEILVAVGDEVKEEQSLYRLKSP